MLKEKVMVCEVFVDIQSIMWETLLSLFVVANYIDA